MQRLGSSRTDIALIQYVSAPLFFCFGFLLHDLRYEKLFESARISKDTFVPLQVNE